MERIKVSQPTDSAIKRIRKALEHELVGCTVDGVRKIPKIRNDVTHGLFVRINNQAYVCIDFENSIVESPAPKVLNITGSLFHGAQVEAALEHDGKLFIAINTFTFALCPPTVKVQFILPEAGEPDKVETDIGQPSASWIPIMQIVRQECGTCSQFLAGGCCELECPIWHMKVKAHEYHKDLYENPCDFCPRSPDKSYSVGVNDIGGNIDYLEIEQRLQGSCGKCPLQIKYGYGVAEGGEIKEYTIPIEQVQDLTKPKKPERKVLPPWEERKHTPKPWDKALQNVLRRA